MKSCTGHMSDKEKIYCTPVLPDGESYSVVKRDNTLGILNNSIYNVHRMYVCGSVFILLKNL